MKKISFIVPVYNCEQYLEDCVNSIREIHLNNYEIILIDDGSKDNSGIIGDQLGRTYQDVCCVHQENQGVSAARNHGLELATGDYIIFLDADDSIEPVKLHEVLKVIETNAQIDLAIYGMTFDYYYHGQCYRRDEMFYSETGDMSREQWLSRFCDLYDVNALSPIWNKVFRKDILERNHLKFNTEMFLYEDLEFSLRYMAYCDVIYNSAECIYHYRQSEDEGNAGRRLKRIEHLPDLIKQIEEALNNLIKVQHTEEQEKQIKSILMSLYLVLAREKISVSNSKEVRKICEDFIKWFQNMGLEIPEQNRKFAEQLLNQKVYSLLVKRFYIAFRHRIAVWVKNMNCTKERKNS